jgi:glutamyl-tRNA synthetase
MAGPPNTGPDGRVDGQLRGRLAPSPTGALHLGNAWAFFMAWLLCRQAGGKLVLRMEDLDPARSRPDYALAVMADLRWLGLDWDEGATEADPQGLRGPCAPYTQSLRADSYRAALNSLEKGGHTYPCFCTRKELRALAGAPHVGDEGAPYPGTCRALGPEARKALFLQGRRPCIRLRCPDHQSIGFTDRVQGPQSLALAANGGDFALRRSDGVIAYQLAVVVDDGLMGINQVVRGRDILPSTPRQLALFDLLGMPRPEYAHLPMIRDQHGDRLAKRHHSLSLRALREQGARPEAVIGCLAWKAGLLAEPQAAHPASLAERWAECGVVLPAWWRERDIMLDDDPLAALLRFPKQRPGLP